jgi:hypothetical protein
VLGIVVTVVLLTAAASGADVQVRLSCLSLRLAPATARQSGLDYTAAVESDTNNPPNGELALADASTGYSHGGFLNWADPTSGVPVFVPFYVNVPDFVDTDQNGLDDFFEIRQKVPTATTDGVYQAPGNTNWSALTATWSRPANAKDGICTLNLLSLGLVFNQPFELIEYDGSLRYTNASGLINGWADLQQFEQPTNVLSGDITLLLVSPDRLSLNDGSWTDASGNALPFGAWEPLNRYGSNYLAACWFADGDPSTPQTDYTDWDLLLTDAHDYNHDGVPDLTDPLPPPTLLLEVDKNRLSLQIQGVAGQSYSVENATDLSQTNWTSVATVTLTNAEQEVPLGSPTGGPQFWRVVWPAHP